MGESLLSLVLMVLSNNAFRAANDSHNINERMQSQGSDFASHQVSTSAGAMWRKKGKKMTLTAQDSGRSLNLPLHAPIVIELAENPTTGYRWQILEDGNPVLHLTKDSFRRGSSTAAGAGGTRVLEFSTENAGAASLRIGYARPSDPAQLKSEFLLHIQVTP